MANAIGAVSASAPRLNTRNNGARSTRRFMPRLSSDRALVVASGRSEGGTEEPCGQRDKPGADYRRAGRFGNAAGNNERILSPLL